VKGTFDFVLTRAVAPMVDLVKWTRKKYSKPCNHEFDNGIIALKGGDLTTELASWGARKTIVSLSTYFEEEFFETKKIVHVAVKDKNQ
jgi:16S rRNA (guanine527-N7)-methyltransferase